jgi:hypothetical protein
MSEKQHWATLRTVKIFVKSKPKLPSKGSPRDLLFLGGGSKRLFRHSRYSGVTLHLKSLVSCAWKGTNMCFFRCELCMPGI